MVKLVIQIPCYNEEITLERTVRDLPQTIQGVDKIEVLVVDDGSTDNTAEVARKLGCHVVSFGGNRGLAQAFMAGLDACLELGANIVVNTDADNQYCGGDISKLVRPILADEADIVIGQRPIDRTPHFSWTKKKLQRLGSWVVRLASQTDVKDAPSGFRAYSREAVLRTYIINTYTYTLETIIQAGRNRLRIQSVPVSTNAETRPSRLFRSMTVYVLRSAQVIIRSFMLYNPLKFFLCFGLLCLLLGGGGIGRFLLYFATGNGAGHIQSLVIACIFILTGVISLITGLLADLIGANRRILEMILYRLKKLN